MWPICKYSNTHYPLVVKAQDVNSMHVNMILVWKVTYRTVAITKLA